MSKYESWKNLLPDEDEELQDSSWWEGKRDVILFCIDCSKSMQELREDPNYEDAQTCHLLTALEAAMAIEKRKVFVGPKDSVGIVMFNTTAKTEDKVHGVNIKKDTFIYQPATQINVETVKDLTQLIDAAREDPDYLRQKFPPNEKHIPVADVFSLCNWVFRAHAPQTAIKRVFLITDEDDPNPGSDQLKQITLAHNNLQDVTSQGVTVEPFFIATDEKPFDIYKFWTTVFQSSNIEDWDDDDPKRDPTVLPEAISITHIDDLVEEMRIYETPKRALFSIPFQLADGFKIGIKGYGLVTEQKKGSYRYFVEQEGEVKPVITQTAYTDEEMHAEVPKQQLVYGMSLGATAADDDDDQAGSHGARAVDRGARVFYTADEVRSFRTLGLEPGLKLLGFKPRSELLFEDNIKHSSFIYPDEMSYSGSKRTFNALLKSMVKKDKMALVLALFRRNSSPIFCAMLPQPEVVDESGQVDPPGFHLIPLPFADDIRQAPINEAALASEEISTAARAWMRKMFMKPGYIVDAYPNPALAYHNAQLEAMAFREEYDPETFDDRTGPKYDMMHDKAGEKLAEWKNLLLKDESATMVQITAGSKRKPDIDVDEAELRSRYDTGDLAKLRVDELKDFLRSKGLPVSGRKADLIERATEWLDAH